jgi:2-keto-4-pentenoate hydratase
MFDQHSALSAARILADRRDKGLQGAVLPEACRPHDLDSALAIQEAVTQVWGQAVGGWKCGTPAADKWVIAPIYATTIHRQSPCPVWARDGQAKVEPELAFVIGQDLPPRAQPYTPAEVDDVIVATHLALELIDSRYAPDAGELSFADKLADGLVNQGLFLGPAVNSERARHAVHLPLRIEGGKGGPQALDGVHPNDDPRAPLYWLAEFLRSRGQGLQAGQVVITGSYAGAPVVPLNENLRWTFGDLGALSVRLEARPVMA